MGGHGGAPRVGEEEAEEARLARAVVPCARRVDVLEVVLRQEPAKAFIRHLAAPEAMTVYKAKGLAL